jgi:hypothetical protein
LIPATSRCSGSSATSGDPSGAARSTRPGLSQDAPPSPEAFDHGVNHHGLSAPEKTRTQPTGWLHHPNTSATWDSVLCLLLYWAR